MAWRGRSFSDDSILARDGSDWICWMTVCQLQAWMALNSCEVARGVSLMMVCVAFDVSVCVVANSKVSIYIENGRRKVRWMHAQAVSIDTSRIHHDEKMCRAEQLLEV